MYIGGTKIGQISVTKIFPIYGQTRNTTLCTGNMQHVLWHDFLCLSQPRIANSGLGPRHVSYNVFFIAEMSNQLFMLWITSCLRSQSAPPASRHFGTWNSRSYRGIQPQVLKKHNFSARVLQEKVINQSGTCEKRRVLPFDSYSDFAPNSFVFRLLEPSTQVSHFHNLLIF